MEEMALLIFTICAQAAIGMMVFAAAAKFVNKEGNFKSVIITSAVLAVVGLLASLMHLGRPLAAINALTQVGNSWLSREIWFTSAFTGITVLAALLLFLKRSDKAVFNALVFAAAVIGFADVFVMVSIYNFASVPAWHSSAIFVEFYAASLSMGAVLFIVLGGKEAVNLKRPAMFIIGAAVIVQVAAMTVYYVQLGGNESLAAQKSLALLNSMGGVLALKWLLIILGSGLLFLPSQKVYKNTVATQTVTELAAAAEYTSNTTVYIAAALLIIGQVIGRYLFYAIMVIGVVGLY